MEAASLRLQEAAAKLLADVRGDCRTSQRAVNTLVSGMNSVTKLYNDVLKEALRKELSAIDGYISIEFIFKVMDNFQDQSIFTGVETCQQFESYLREKSGGRKVKLKKATVEYTTVVRKGIPRIVPFKFGYVVSFLSQLEQFLNCPDVLQCVDNPLPTKSGVYRTVTDGLFYRFHPVVQKHGPTTLAVLMHVDDAEICDSLKSKAGKNSLRLFYWTLGNIHPEKRSSLKAINLLAIACAKVAKAYGNDFLLRSFIRDMIRLGTTGVDLNIAGQVRRVYAVLLFASCDNPAAANLGKFKETHSALRPCRVCMVKSSEMCEHFREDRALLRNLAEHEEHVRQVMRKEILEVGQQLAVSDSDEDSSMEIDDPDQDDESAGNVYLDHKVASVNYGVNGESILSKAPGFDVTKCLPQDIMHVLNEGVIEVVCRLIIKDLCLPPRPRAKPVMDLEMFNHCIGSLFDLGHLSVSKPTEIERGHLLGKKLKQSASQMIVLLRLLPFIIHNRLPQEKLDLVLKANSIVDSSMAFETSNADVSKLEDLIEDFGNLFKTLYPWIKTLKLHCLSHLGSQTKILGPLRQHACFRYEAMHSEFTQIFDVVLTMKNPAETAAKRHLAHRNADLMQGRNGGYLNENDGAFGVSDVCLGNLPEKHCLLEKFPHLTEESFVSKVNRLVYRGSDWHGGVIMLLNRESNLFGRISACYKTGNDVFFTYNYLETKHMSCYNAFEILKCTEEYHVISFDEMKHLFPMWRVSYKFRRFLRSFILAQPPANIY